MSVDMERSEGYGCRQWRARSGHDGDVVSATDPSLEADRSAWDRDGDGACAALHSSLFRDQFRDSNELDTDYPADDSRATLDGLEGSQSVCAEGAASDTVDRVGQASGVHGSDRKHVRARVCGVGFGSDDQQL